MARAIKWRHRIYELAERARRSTTETWTRQDIERLFEVGRGSAQTILIAIGDTTNIGGKHVVSRTSLLTYLEYLIGSEDLGIAHRARLGSAMPAPKPRFLTNPVPDDLVSIMVRDLPADITLEPGRIELRGTNAVELIKRLVLLSKAMQNDLDTAVQLLNPVRPKIDPVDDELRAMFDDLKQRESKWPAR